MKNIMQYYRMPAVSFTNIKNMSLSVLENIGAELQLEGVEMQRMTDEGGSSPSQESETLADYYLKASGSIRKMLSSTKYI